MRYYFLALGTLVAVFVGCAVDGQQVLDKHEYHAPPAEMMVRPGPMVDGPGPGVMPMLAPPPQRSFAATTTQVRFIGPAGMHVGWMVPDGYAENQLVTPGRYNFIQGASYRLKFTNIPGAGREGLVLYPTLQVYPSHPTTDAYLSHNSVPLQITVEDLDQVESNNFVTKVIYLPEAKYQELAIAGVETLVSTRLDPGVDPVSEASRRGTVMAVLRMGNMDLEMNAPPVDGMVGMPGGLQQVAHTIADGDDGKFVPPLPIAMAGSGIPGVPAAMIAAQSGMPGAPAGPYPVSGMGGMPMWGHPITGTPIGLPGPTHLPYGGPASLKSHTVRNLTEQNLGKPVDHFLMDVKHDPGLSTPPPVKYVQYKETHPVYKQGEVAYPAFQQPPYGAAPNGAYCPPGQQPPLR